MFLPLILFKALYNEIHMKVQIKNFQSLEDVSFTVQGFTVLIGRSNLGKSATIRAIEGALFNSPVDAYVREGTQTLQVQLQSPEFDILWRKGGGHNDYIVDGVSYENVGRDVPDVIKKKGFRDLELNRNSLRIQISDQFHPLFLLDCSGADAAQAISDVDRIYEIQNAQEAVEKDRRQMRSEIKVREKDLKIATQRKIDLLEQAPSMDTLRQVVSRSQALSRARTRTSGLRASAGRYKSLTTHVRVCTRACDINIPTLPLLHHEVTRQRIRLGETLGKRINAYQPITTPTLPSQPLKVLRDLRLYLSLQHHLLCVPLVKKLAIPHMPESTTRDKVHAAQLNLKRLVAKIREFKSDLVLLEDDIARQEEAYHAMVEDTGNCPVCGQNTQKT